VIPIVAVYCGWWDQDYPHTNKGYAFEIGTAAAKRVVKSFAAPPGFSYDFQTVCRKDSLDLVASVRAPLASACDRAFKHSV